MKPERQMAAVMRAVAGVAQTGRELVEAYNDEYGRQALSRGRDALCAAANGLQDALVELHAVLDGAGRGQPGPDGESVTAALERAAAEICASGESDELLEPTVVCAPRRA